MKFAHHIRDILHQRNAKYTQPRGETGHAYNDLPPWRYAQLPEAFGCQGWWSGRVATVAELEQALTAINAHDGGAYLEVMIPPEESQPLAETLIETMHQTATPHPEAAE